MKLKNLEDLYVDQLKDLYSAEKQLVQALPKMAKAASTPELQQGFQHHLEQTRGHVDRLERIFSRLGASAGRKKCKGMEGLVAEATKHVLEEGPEKGPLLDVMIIAQYQRMTHYGIAGFGTAAAYAKALGLKDDHKALNAATKDIYGGDEYMTKLAETSVNIDAEDA